MTEEKKLPDISNIAYNAADVRRAMQQKRHKEGWVALLLKSIRQTAIKNSDDLILMFGWNTLKDPEDLKSVEGRQIPDFLHLPFQNPEIKDAEGKCVHEPPNNIKQWRPLLRALDPEKVSDYAYRDRESKQWMFQGKVVTEEEAKDLDDRSCDEAYRFLIEICKDPQALVSPAPHYTVWGRLTQNGDYTNISNYRGELYGTEGQNEKTPILSTGKDAKLLEAGGSSEGAKSGGASQGTTAKAAQGGKRGGRG